MIPGGLINFSNCKVLSTVELEKLIKPLSTESMDDFAQDCDNSSELGMELLLSCT